MSSSTASASTTNPGTSAAAAGNPATADLRTAAGTSGVAPGIGAAGGTGVSGQAVGDKIKGGLGVIHGAGEAIRGNINDFFDTAGEGIANRSPNDPQPIKRTDGGMPSASVADNGVKEMQRGMDELRK